MRSPARCARRSSGTSRPAIPLRNGGTARSCGYSPKISKFRQNLEKRFASIERAHPRPEPLVDTAAPRVHGRQRVRVHIRRPQAVERDEVTIAAVHAGDAVIFVPSCAVEGGNLVRHGLALTGPRENAAGVVTAVDLRL